MSFFGVQLLDRFSNLWIGIQSQKSHAVNVGRDVQTKIDVLVNSCVHHLERSYPPLFFLRQSYRSLGRSRLRGAALITTPFVHWTSIFWSRLTTRIGILSRRGAATRIYPVWLAREFHLWEELRYLREHTCAHFQRAINLFPVCNFRRSHSWLSRSSPFIGEIAYFWW